MSHPTSRRFYRGPRQEPGQTRHPHSSRVAYVGATITKGTSASKFAPPDLGHGATVIEGPSAGTLIPSDFGDGSTDIEGPSAFTPAPSNFGDGMTVIEGPSPSTGNADARAPSGSTVDKEAKSSFVTEPQSTFAEMSDYFSEERPFVVLMEEKGVIGALQILDQRLRTAGYDKILSNKKPIPWIGKKIAPGQIGLMNQGGMPKLLTKPGHYLCFPLRNWWARSYEGTRSLSESLITFQGLTVVQVSRNQVAVISDPQNHVFVLKNSGFVAYGIDGSYDVLAIVDPTRLPHVVKDHVTGSILGRSLKIWKSSNRYAGIGPANSVINDYVVALFLDIPANNCAVVQCENYLEQLPAGQHCIVHPTVTLRGLYTLGENEFEMSTRDILTHDHVPVIFTLHLKWRLEKPLKLTTREYEMPYDVLRDKTQSILTRISAHIEYGSMVSQRSLGGDRVEDGEFSPQALDALRTQVMGDLYSAALEHGIILRDLVVIEAVAHTLQD